MHLYKASIHNYFFNTINAVVMIVNGIIMVPVYLKYMTISTYGAWLATGNVVAILGLIESGFATVITQKISVAYVEKDVKRFKELAGSNVFIAFSIFVFVFLIGFPLYFKIASWINAESGLRDSISTAYLISLLSTSISFLVSLFGVFPQVWQETKVVGYISTVVNVLTIFLLILYLNLGFGIVGLALGYLTRSLLNLICQGLWIYFRWKKLKLGKLIYQSVLIKSLLKDCIFPFFSRSSNVILSNSSNFFIAIFFNPSLATIFDLTGKIVNVSSSFVGMANGSFFGLLSRSFAEKNQNSTERLVLKFSNFYFVILISALFFSILLSKYVIKYWVGLDKFGGDLLLFLIAISAFLFQSKQYFINLLYAGGNIYKSSKFDLISLFIYLLILFTSFKFLKLYAIPIASILSFGLLIYFYIKIIKTELNIKPYSIFNSIFKLIIFIIPFLMCHYSFGIQLPEKKYLSLYIIFIIFIYFGFLYFLFKSSLQELYKYVFIGKGK